MPSPILSEKKATYRILLLNLITSAGLLLAFYLTYHFYEVRNGTAGLKSFCNIAATLNCDAVAASSYAEIIPGLPLSSLAAGWYLAFFIVSLIAHNVYWRREALRAALIFSGASVVSAIPYIFIMALKLKTFCLFCLILDGISLSSLGVTVLLSPESPFNKKWDFSKWKVFALITAGSLFVSALSLKSMDGDTPPPESDVVKNYVNTILSNPPIHIKTGQGMPSIGPESTPITVVEYSDFQCPYCRMGAYKLHAAMNAHLGQVRIEYRNFPLDQACNPAVHRSAHPVACEAAKVAMCAHELGHFEAVYNELFDKQSSFKPGRPIELAQSAGLDRSKMESCVNTPKIAQIVNQDILDGISLNIQSTPTCFVNGYRVEGVYPVEAWNLLFDRLLAQQQEHSGIKEIGTKK